MLLGLVLWALIANYVCSYKDMITIESSRIRIKHGLGYREHFVDTSSFSSIEPENCSEPDIACVKWGDKGRIRITRVNDKCWFTEVNESLPVSFNISGLNIFGGPERKSQSWPMGNIEFDAPYVSSGNNYVAVLESYWLDSRGCYVYVNLSVPLFVKQNETTLVIVARNVPPYNRTEKNVTLTYTTCQFDNVVHAHQNAVNTVLMKPNRCPNFQMIRSPVWSTWAKYKNNITQEIVEEFADAIVRHGFEHSQLEIDDKWETCYGSFEVDHKKFPSMKNLSLNLKRKGFKRVTLWVHPFINNDCNPSYSDAKTQNFFVKTNNGSTNTTWWNSGVGMAGYIDFTNPKAVIWWKQRLMSLKKTTLIDSFKFDAGESSFTPQVPVFNVTKYNDHPETILKAYVDVVSHFGDAIEVRVGRGTQQYGLFVRMIDRNSRWTGDLGLTTLIPELLHLNIIGYPFVLPDMIGGNGYWSDVLTEELFIRWLQVNVFMPVLQFSYPPWDFSDEAVRIAKQMVNLHGSYAAKIHDLMIHANKTGDPVNRPLWWIDPTDPVCLSIDSEFLLGNDILVAPVLEEGAKSRDIFLPTGFWKDEHTKSPQIIKGPVWLKHYPAELSVLPYFSRVYSSSASFLLPWSIFMFVISIILTYMY